MGIIGLVRLVGLLNIFFEISNTIVLKKSFASLVSIFIENFKSRIFGFP